jgi:hypothetical protein
MVSFEYRQTDNSNPAKSEPWDSLFGPNLGFWNDGTRPKTLLCIGLGAELEHFKPSEILVNLLVSFVVASQSKKELFKLLYNGLWTLES